MKSGFIAVDIFLKRLDDSRRRFHFRATKAEVIYVFFPYIFFKRAPSSNIARIIDDFPRLSASFSLNISIPPVKMVYLPW
jgi:hypothetical protein